MSQSTRFTWLVCDAGGTNCTFALVAQEDRRFRIQARTRYESRTITDFSAVMEEALQALLRETRAEAIAGGCISAAGPVHDGSVTLTNTSWSIHEREISTRLDVPVHLVNDLTAIGYALPLVHRADSEQCVSVWNATPARTLPVVEAVAAAGTGLGVAIACELPGHGLTVLPSEGGHTDLIGFDEETRQFQHFVESTADERPDAEMYASGKGLRHAAAFVIAKGGFQHGAAKEILSADPLDYPAIVSRHAATDSDAASAMRLFAKMYGRFAAGLALSVLPYGGLFLAGGVTARNLDAIVSNGFLDGYFSHPHESMQTALRRVPVYALRSYDISLVGAAHAAYLAHQEETP